jgi:hypothetical protein
MDDHCDLGPNIRACPCKNSVLVKFKMAGNVLGKIQDGGQSQRI